MANVLTTSTLYKLTFTISEQGGTGAKLSFYDSNVNPAYSETAYPSGGWDNGTHSHYFVTPSDVGDNGLAIFAESSGGAFKISDISLKAVSNDLVAYYPLDESNSGSVGIATDSVVGETLGSELVTSLTNNSNSWETYSDSGATVLSATNDAGTGAEIFSNVMHLNTGDLIKVVFTITQNSGTTRLQMSDQYGNYTSGDLNELISSSGTYTFYTLISHPNMDVLKLKVETTPNDIANVTFSAKKVTSNTGVLK